MRRPFSLLSALLLLLPLLGPPDAALAENRALIVGIGKYAIPSANLPGIEKDIRMMRDVATMLGYKPEQIMVLQDDKATLAGLRQTITQWLVDGVTPDDQVLFYFSGHGSQVADDNGDEADQADEVLVTHDVRHEKGTLTHVYRDDDFGALLASIPAKRAYVLIDACHSGTATRGVGGKTFPKFLSYPGMPRGKTRGFTEGVRKGVAPPATHVALCAAQDDQQAQASDQGSFFTLGVLEAVKRAANTGEPITMRELLAETTQYIDTSLDNPSIAFRPVLSGASTLMTSNLFVSKGEGQKPAQLEKGWWEKLEELADGASYAIPVRANKYLFKIGDALSVTCRIRKAGYLNIVNISPGESTPTVLFPNTFHPDNRVQAGQTVSIPDRGDRFALKATPPVGKSLIVALHTDYPLNFHQDGYGDGLFRDLSVTSTRGFAVIEQAPTPTKPPVAATQPEQPPAPRAYGAGSFVVRIEP
ncbi:MAG: caspase family protein [Desulfovibrionaceae bacterium]